MMERLLKKKTKKKYRKVFLVSIQTRPVRIKKVLLLIVFKR